MCETPDFIKLNTIRVDVATIAIYDARNLGGGTWPYAIDIISYDDTKIASRTISYHKDDEEQWKKDVKLLDDRFINQVKL